MNRFNLDQYVDGVWYEGKVEPSRVGLALEKRREKRSDFRFERPSQWILKVVQALVLAGVDSCKVHQSHQRTEIVIRGRGSVFSAEEIEGALRDPEAPVSDGLEHLVMALGFLSLELDLTWAWKDNNSVHCLICRGRQLSKVKSVRSDYATLQVSHTQNASKGSWLAPLLKVVGLVGPDMCAQISRELNLHAYCCPFPLKLDGLQVDNLASCLTHGPKAGALATECIAPPVVKALNKDLWWRGLLLGHLTSGRTGVSPAACSSKVTWVRHGVAVGESPLATDCGASVHLFLSADQLKLDPYGLSILKLPDGLQLEILESVIEWLRSGASNVCLGRKFAALAIADSEGLNRVLRKEVATLITQLRAAKSGQGKSFSVNQMLTQVHTEMGVQVTPQAKIILRREPRHDGH